MAEGFSDGFLGEVDAHRASRRRLAVTTIAAEIVDVVYDVEHDSTTPMAATEHRDPTLDRASMSR